MGTPKKKNTILLRLDDREMRNLDARRTLEQKKHPGRVVTRAGLARELIAIGLMHLEAEPH